MPNENTTTPTRAPIPEMSNKNIIVESLAHMGNTIVDTIKGSSKEDRKEFGEQAKELKKYSGTLGRFNKDSISILKGIQSGLPEGESLSSNDIQAMGESIAKSNREALVKLPTEIAVDLGKVMGGVISQGFNKISSNISGSIQEILPGLSGIVGSVGGIALSGVKSLAGKIGDRKDVSKERREQAAQDAMTELAERGNEKGSIYTHDIHLEGALTKLSEQNKSMSTDIIKSSVDLSKEFKTSVNDQIMSLEKDMSVGQERLNNLVDINKNIQRLVDFQTPTLGTWQKLENSFQDLQGTRKIPIEEQQLTILKESRDLLRSTFGEQKKYQKDATRESAFLGGFFDELQKGITRFVGVGVSLGKSVFNLGKGAFNLFKKGDKKKDTRSAVEKQTDFLSGINEAIKKNNDIQIETLDIWKDMLGIEKDRDKKSDRKTDTKKDGGGLMGLLKTLIPVFLFGIGVVIGQAIKYFLTPFKAIAKAVGFTPKIIQVIGKGIKSIYNSIKDFKIVKQVREIFTKILLPFQKLTNIVKESKIVKVISRFFTKILEPLKSIGKFIGNIFSKITAPFKVIFASVKGATKSVGTLGKIFSKVSGFLNPLIKGIAKGMKIFPLFTVVLTFIDFIKGFMSTEGDIFAKIKGGLMGVVEGFISIPTKIIGWLVDKILGLFGVKIEGGAGDAIMDGLMKSVNFVLDLIIFPFKSLWNSIQNLIEYFKTSDSEGGSVISDFMGYLSYVFLNLGKTILLYSPIGLLYQGIMKLWEWISTPNEEGVSVIDTIWTSLKNIFSSIGQAIMNYTPIGIIYKGIMGLYDWLTTPSEGPGIIDTIYNTLFNIFSSIGQAIMDYTPIGMAYRGIMKIWDFFNTSSGEDSIFDKLIKLFQDIPGMISDWILGLIKKIPGAETAIAAVKNAEKTVKTVTTGGADYIIKKQDEARAAKLRKEIKEEAYARKLKKQQELESQKKSSNLGAIDDQKTKNIKEAVITKNQKEQQKDAEKSKEQKLMMEEQTKSIQQSNVNIINSSSSKQQPQQPVSSVDDHLLGLMVTGTIG